MIIEKVEHSNWFKLGKHNPQWKGGITYDREYILRLSPGHPRAKKGGSPYVREHILVMEEYLGRYLTENEIVHHINGIKTDNRIENLELTDRTEHPKHHTKDMSKRKCLICNSNVTYIDKKGWASWHRHPITKQEFICRKCYNGFRYT